MDVAILVEPKLANQYWKRNYVIIKLRQHFQNMFYLIIVSLAER